MPNVMSVLKDEIRRLARKEVKAAVVALQRDKVLLKKRVRELGRHFAHLVRENKLLAAAQAKLQPAAPAEIKGRMWVSSKGVRSLRRKLGLSQPAFARLLGVSVPTVFLWEHKKGALKLRGKTRQAIAAARGMGAREAKRRLAEMGWVDRRRLKRKKR